MPTLAKEITQQLVYNFPRATADWFWFTAPILILI